MKEKERGKERGTWKKREGGVVGGEKGEPPKVVMKGRKEKAESKKECVYVFIERVCRIMCVIVSPVPRGRG